MSSIAAEVPSAKTARASIVFIALHCVALAAQLPLLLVYFRKLWDQPHYQQFFPFVLLVVGVLVYLRMKRTPEGIPLRASWLANVFLALSIPFLLAANLLFIPEFAIVGCVLLAGSLLVRLIDAETGRSLLPVWLLLLLLIRPPFNQDHRLIAWLQWYTSKAASMLLDLLGVRHQLDGNVIRLAERNPEAENAVKDFMVEEACSGVLSLFVLLFIALAFVIIMRRPWFRAVLLLLSAVFWAGFMNTVRILAITVGYDWSQGTIDLSHGMTHTILGYICLGVAAALILSTDSFLSFLFGPVAEEALVGSNSQRRIGRFWNRIISGKRDSDGARKARSRRLITSSAVIAALAVCSILVIVGFVPLVRLGISPLWRQITQPYIVIDVPSEALPAELQLGASDDPAAPAAPTWKMLKHETQERELNSLWGSRSSRWAYAVPVPRPANQSTAAASETPASSGEEVVLQYRFDCSCDYPFSDWHDLTVCYRGNGWKISHREVVFDPAEGDDWPLVELELSRPTGERMLVLFSLFDENGYGLRPPATEMMADLGYIRRVQLRLTKHEYRDYGPFPQSYQVQHIINAQGPISPQMREWLIEAHLKNRATLRDYVKAEGSGRGETATEAATTDPAPAIRGDEIMLVHSN